ncbi:uncharacterized protein [Miscanthus floridulus]|uniref:uncharacterized protein n=1 Tax=Miscanthus floridulus TaxID=154761 RepID=UPI00345ACA8A
MSGRQEPRSKHMHDPALEKYKKARQEMHPRFKPTSRRSTRAASSAAAQYAEGSGSSSSDTDTDEFRVESREERKRKSTDRGSDDDYASDWWSDLTGGGGYYGSGDYDPSGAGGSRLAGVSRSDDEDAGRDKDDDDE